MNEQQAIQKMVAPGTRRPGKYREGVIQIHVTRTCDKSCYGCTQGSNLRGKVTFISPEQFEQAVLSLKGYFGVVGVFGGNPALHPRFDVLCEILRRHVPFEQRGLWCNHPFRWGKVMRETFDPSVSNLNVHLDHEAYNEFKRSWPESNPVGLHLDSRHSPPYVALKDVLKKPCPNCEVRNRMMFFVDPGPCDNCGGSYLKVGKVYDEEAAWDLISDCDINKHWSAMIGVFRGELRAWFCEIAGAQAILHQDEEDYPDTGIPLVWESGGEVMAQDVGSWWRLPMERFAHQVRKHCHDCGVPLRGYGELAQTSDDRGKEQVSETHRLVYRPKRKERKVELVTVPSQLGVGKISKMTDYLGNARK